MEENKNTEVIKRIENTIDSLKNRTDCTLYFFVADSKNVPNAKMEYIYNIALTLHDKGYKVCMLYQNDIEYKPKELEELIRKEMPIDERKQFVGVKGWLGEKYGKLKHLNIANGTWSVSPSDFLFIPEVFSSLMKESYQKRIPCKRYVIMQNFHHITEFIPFGDQWASYGITDAIVPTKKQGDLLKSVFKYVNVRVLSPFINEMFRKPLKAKKLIVNIISKTKEDAEHIVKTFYWKYPPFNFVSFRFLNNFPKEKYCEMLKESAITVWVDSSTSFGYSALESMRCGNIVIGKVPDLIPEWMMDENGELIPNGFWVNEIDEISDVLASVVNEWIDDEIEDFVYDKMDKTNERYHFEEWDKNLSDIMDDIFDNRVKEMEIVKKIAENNMKGEQK